MEVIESRSTIQTLSYHLNDDARQKFDKENIYGYTPLVFSIKKNYLKLAYQLIDAGFYDELRTDEYTDMSILHHICCIQDEPFIKICVDKFIRHINHKDRQGNTPLHYAAFKRNQKYCEVLIQNGADLNSQNELGYCPLHLAWASNNPKFDHSSKLEEYLIDNGAEVDALNNECETPLMMLFKLDGEDEMISKTNKYDPITTLMVFLKNNANINLWSKSKKTPLHYACIRGSTISALTLINNGADWNAQDYSETTPYGYAMKNNHEDLCIFLIQQGNLIDVSIKSVVINSEHEYNQINSLQRFANSPEIEELFKQKSALEKLPNYRKIEENYCKLESYSPFYYAIKNNMQGNIYLLIVSNSFCI